MQDTTDAVAKQFGYVLAFLLPGFTGLCLLALLDARSHPWLLAAMAQMTTVGGFLFWLLASLAVGVFLGALRWQVLDRWVFNPMLRKKGIVPVSELPGLNDVERLPVYIDCREQHYRFYQFYGNTALVVLAVYAYVAIARRPTPWWWTVVFAAVEVVLFPSAYQQLRDYRKKVKELVAAKKAEVNDGGTKGKPEGGSQEGGKGTDERSKKGSQPRA